jgi:hypothetical protein
MTRLLMNFIKIGSHLAEVFVKSQYVGVEKVTKLIIKGSGKSRGMYS